MDKIEFLWSGFEPLSRIFVVGTLAYISIIIILRISGSRSLATMNAFDFIITVTLGSAFGRILTAKNVALSEALLAFVLLVGLQFLISTLEVKFPFLRKIITSRPSILFYDGRFLKKNMNKKRVDKEAILGAARKKGFKSLDEIEVIILETNGSFSVVGKSENNRNLTYEELLKKSDLQ